MVWCDSLLSPNRNKLGIFDGLKFVFGQLPSQVAEEIKQIQSGKQACDSSSVGVWCVGLTLLSFLLFISVTFSFPILPFIHALCLVELLLVKEALQEEEKIHEMIDSLENKKEELLPLKETQNDYKLQLKEFQDEGYLLTQSFSPPC